MTLPLIQGHTPGSQEEVWIANTLYKFKIPFIYQFEVAGGLRIRGGMAIDFMLTHPRYHPFEFYGDYWHEREVSGGDLLRIKAMEDIFHVKPYILWGKDAPDETAVVTWIKKNILR